MIVPTLQLVNTMIPGTVFTVDNSVFYMVCTATAVVNLANGGITEPIDPAFKGIPFPDAYLVLG